ncbi:MAG TPA: PAS domain S-box protein, partial [Acidimicrobiales bacterium]|nr:PAS domain S-box protein [Acidimicrobiales bacterium]
ARAGTDHHAHRDRYFEAPTERAMGAGLELAARRKDGSEFPVDISLSSLETDDGPLVSAAVRDSSERKNIEAKIQILEASSRMASIVESSDDAIIGETLEGIVTSWNAGAEHMYGYAADDIIGHDISELIPLERVDEMASILARVRRGERVEHYETSGVGRANRILDLSMSISPIRDATGRVTGASTVARDLTGTNLAEVDRRALEAQLQQAQRLESIGQLAGGVAHDFNNLLAGIMNYAGLASISLKEEMTRCGLSDDPAFVTVVQDVDEITKVAKRAAVLTHQLLIFSRREVVQPEVLDLNAVVGEMEGLLRRTIGENVDQLNTLFAPDLPLIKADRGQIDQVIMNLAVNARDAMPGGGKLGIETARFEVDEQYARIRAIRPGTYARLSVSDTGEGMSEEVAARALEPFFTTKPKGEGTGLGLATVYGIATQAGGDITIHSELGLGTTVRVYLPATLDSRSHRGEGGPDVPLVASGETVLLVEDEDFVREPARRMLARRGYVVLAAASADEALDIVKEHPGDIDLLLTDVVMPGRSGKELSADVAELRPEVRVLFMSGYSQDVIAHQGVLEEGLNLIEKPFSAEDLLRRVRDVLAGAP